MYENGKKIKAQGGHHTAPIPTNTVCLFYRLICNFSGSNTFG
jgi:hypothetical protein